MTAPVGRIAEVFRSYQGEGMLLGQRQVFVRLAGCEVGCRYCDTEWAFATPPSVAVPGAARERWDNPLTVEQVCELVARADPPAPDVPPAPVSLTGGEPLEQADFAEALVAALAPREVMLETAGLDLEALRRLAPRVRWIACDVKLPTATGRREALDEHDAVLASGVLAGADTFYKLIVDGDVPDGELAAAFELLARHAPGRPVFLQPVTPLGGSPRLPRERLDRVTSLALARGLDVRVVPQVHKFLRVR